MASGFIQYTSDLRTRTTITLKQFKFIVDVRMNFGYSIQLPATVITTCYFSADYQSVCYFSADYLSAGYLSASSLLSTIFRAGLSASYL